MEKNIALVRRGYETLQSGDVDALAELITENFIANIPGLPEPLRGREPWRRNVEAMLEGFPDLQIDIDDMFGAGDKVAVLLRFHGTHNGQFQGVPPTHRRVSFSSIEVYRLEGDKIAEEWVSPDILGLMRQISAN